MRIVWDEPKRLANIEKHGLDFANLSLEFFDTALVGAARGGRRKAIGRLADGTIVVIFVQLGSERLSVISMRTARRDERGLIE